MIRAALLAICALLAVVALQWVKLQSVERQLASVAAELAGQKEAARFRFRLGEAQAGAAALDAELQKGSGADAPLSDYLRGAAGRVWK